MIHHTLLSGRAHDHPEFLERATTASVIPMLLEIYECINHYQLIQTARVTDRGVDKCTFELN